MTTEQLYGIMAEWDNPDDLLHAAQRASIAGFHHMDAYTPYPVEGLPEAVGCRPTRLPFLVLCGGLFGGIGGFFMQYYANVHAYPLNVGGRPYNSWPAFVPISFELTILCAALTAVFAMLIANGLPMPYHPVFNAPDFQRASRNRFFLCIEATDPHFDRWNTREFLETLNPERVSEVAC